MHHPQLTFGPSWWNVVCRFMMKCIHDKMLHKFWYKLFSQRSCTHNIWQLASSPSCMLQPHTLTSHFIDQHSSEKMHICQLINMFFFQVFFNKPTSQPEVLGTPMQKPYTQDPYRWPTHFADPSKPESPPIFNFSSVLFPSFCRVMPEKVATGVAENYNYHYPYYNYCACR